QIAATLKARLRLRLRVHLLRTQSLIREALNSSAPLARNWQLNGNMNTKTAKANQNLNVPDLTQRPPRSPRQRLGGYPILPRMLDKGRATIAGKEGEYHFNCPLDQRFVEFTGINAEELKAELASGKGDGEILNWINANSKTKPKPWEIAAWAAYQDARGPDDAES